MPDIRNPEPESKGASVLCPLCKRPIPPQMASRHHLVPKLKGGAHGETVILHSICHSKIHTTFTEAELARDYSTIEALESHPEIRKFVRWIQKRPPEHRSRNRRSTAKRRR